MEGLSSNQSEDELTVARASTATNDALITRLTVTTGTPALCLSTRRVRWLLAALRATFTTTVRMLMVAHCNAASRWTTTEPAIATCLTEHNIRVIGIADFADGCAAIHRDLANFARRKHEGCPSTFFIRQARRHACRAAESSASLGLHLDVVHRKTCWNVSDWHAIANLWFHRIR